MLQVSAGYAFALGCALIVILGDTVLKTAADKGHTITSPHLIIGCALYAISAIAWFLAMRHITLAQGAIAYSMFSLIALCLIGVVMFGETMALREYAGIACAVAAVVLMVRFV